MDATDYTHITETLSDLKITVQSTFIPFSKSRNADEKQPSLNWKVAVLVNGKEVLRTDYMAGMAHCPSYKPHMGRIYRDVMETIRLECENGKRKGYWGKVAEPKARDVVHSLITDAGALDYAGFEDWADNYGYDTDSRKAEAIYRQCLDIAVKLRAALGDEGLKRLQETFQDY